MTDQPPDGGYGWVVVFGAALAQFLLVGLGRCLGIIHVALLTQFGASETKTAWVSAVFNTFRTLTGNIMGTFGLWAKYLLMYVVELVR